MRCVGHIFVAKLLNFHLFGGVRPRVEAYLTTLRVEWKVGYFYEAARVQSNLGHPGHLSVRTHPRIEVFKLGQVLVTAHAKEICLFIKVFQSF